MAALELAPGAELGRDGRYRLRRVLGIGGMASVWLADDTRLARPVAIKVLADSLALDLEYVTRFEREARIAAGLAHPHLVKLFDFSVDWWRPFLVMEYITGGTLASRLAAPVRPRLDVVRLLRELLEAVDYIHRAGIVHRDIKPGNVLIDLEDHARLTDFGIAQPADATRITQVGLVLGSERYLAPEVMRGGPATRSSDLYACGILLRDCLTSRADPRLAALASALSAHDPADRPASARAAASLLPATDHRHAPAPVPAPALATPPRRPAPTAATVPQRAARRPSGWRRALAVFALTATAAFLVAFGLVAGRGSGPRARPPAATPAAAPLATKLAGLDRAVAQSRR